MTSVCAAPSSLRASLRLLAGVVVAAIASNAWAADVERGERLAKRWCAACHIVAPDQSHGRDDAPPFATIAKIPAFNAEAVSRFLLSPHPRMPDMQLTRDEAEDLAVYIARQNR